MKINGGSWDTYLTNNFLFNDGSLTLFDNKMASDTPSLSISPMNSISNSDLSTLRTNPLKIKINNFVANEKLYFIFRDSLGVANKYPIKTYLQKSEFPFKIMSSISEPQRLSDSDIFYSLIVPLVGQDMHSIDLVVDLGLSEQNIM